jgi:hypothetical protein
MNIENVKDVGPPVIHSDTYWYILALSKNSRKTSERSGEQKGVKFGNEPAEKNR